MHLHLRLLDVPEPVARQGQRERRRVLSERSMQQHSQRWEQLVPDLSISGTVTGAHDVAVLRREASVLHSR